MLSINDVRVNLARKLAANELVVTRFQAEKRASATVELTGDSFIADSPTIFGEPNADYIARELEWYKSMSLNVNDIPGQTPDIWKKVADPEGNINSNYGWCIFSHENVGLEGLDSKYMQVGTDTFAKCQYNYAIIELLRDNNSRRATMIYTRPNMHSDCSKYGRSDFMCTNTVQLLIRDNKLTYIVNMRSNDVIMGYRNDWAWHDYVQKLAVTSLNRYDLKLEAGPIIWHADSLHVYDKQFYLLDHFNRTGEFSITKARYRELYPTSPFN